jgi:hypothetical protein
VIPRRSIEASNGIYKESERSVEHKREMEVKK